MRGAPALLGALAVSCGGGGVAIEATLEQALAGEVKVLQIAFLARPQAHDCRFILGNGCLVGQDKPLVELADGPVASLPFAPGPDGQDVTIEGVPVGKYMLVVEALGANDELLGNACDPLVEVRPSGGAIQVTVRAWEGPACNAGFD